MVTPIAEDVDEYSTHFTRSPENSLVIPIRPDHSSKPVHAIDCASHSNRKASQAARERYLVVCFANEMHVATLNGVVHYSATKSISGRRDCGDKDASRLGEPQGG
jgi:hypothetical protein